MEMWLWIDNLHIQRQFEDNKREFLTIEKKIFSSLLLALKVYDEQYLQFLVPRYPNSSPLQNIVSCILLLPRVPFTGKEIMDAEYERDNIHMLVLSGIEFIFFTATNVGLNFGSLLEAVLLIQGCFSGCWAGLLAQHQGLFCSSPHATIEEAGVRYSQDSCTG